MQPRSLLVMAGVVTTLAAFIFFYEKDLPSTDERARLEKKVFDLAEADVLALEIEHGDTSLRIERQPADPAKEENDTEDDSLTAPAATWRLVKPLSARADRAQVEGLLGDLTGLEKKRSLEEIDRTAAGLDQAAAQVKLITDEREIVLEIGNEIPASSDRFVALAGSSSAFQAGVTFFDKLVREPGEWRDRNLFASTSAQIVGIEIQHGETHLSFEKDGDAFWIDHPFRDLAGEGLVNELTTEISGLTVTDFLDEAPAAFDELGLDPPLASLKVTLADQDEAFRLDLGQPLAAGDVTHYARAQGQLISLDSRLIELTQRPVEAWRSHAWSGLQVFKIDSAELTDASGTLKISREGADWKRGEDRVAYSVVSDLLYAITEIEAEAVLDAAEGAVAVAAEPRLTVSLATQDEDGGEVLRLYSQMPGERFAATADHRPVTFLLSAEKVAELETKLSELRQAEPLPENQEDQEDQEDQGDAAE